MKKVLHDESSSRFVIEVDGTEAGFAAYEEAGEGVRNFNHTVIDPASRGQGLSKPLIIEALECTREQGLKVIPTCSAVAAFIEKNPDFGSLVAEDD